MKIKIDMPIAPITLKLELTRAEALALKTVFGKVAGPMKGPRGMTDKIYGAIEKLISQDTIGLGTGHIDMPDSWDSFQN